MPHTRKIFADLSRKAAQETADEESTPISKKDDLYDRDEDARFIIRRRRESSEEWR
jgi:hypothetical protein